MKTLIVEGSRPIGKPVNWDEARDGPCGTLHVVDHVDAQGHATMFSFYKPTAEDILALANGGMLRLGILGKVHPVINMSVMGPKVVEASKPTEDLDMGPVIELGEQP